MRTECSVHLVCTSVLPADVVDSRGRRNHSSGGGWGGGAASGGAPAMWMMWDWMVRWVALWA